MYTLPVLLIFRNIRENSLELLSLSSCEGENEMESRAIRTKKIRRRQQAKRNFNARNGNNGKRKSSEYESNKTVNRVQ